MIVLIIICTIVLGVAFYVGRTIAYNRALVKKLIKYNFNKNIQLHKYVIYDIIKNINNKTNPKMLVFGLGYDSKMWITINKNTFFVEDSAKYIELNKSFIPQENIIQYSYDNISVRTSFVLSNSDIEKYTLPEKLKNEAPFDIILIDGPVGNNMSRPGRLLPCYFSTLISKKNTLIYVDDSRRKLETYCIKKYFRHKPKFVFKQRLYCTRILM